MIEPTLVSMMEHWGYSLAPSPHPYAPGQHVLLVAMREIPTEMHFDPESIQLRMGETGDTLNWSTIRLKYPLHGVRQAGLGRVIVSDRVEKQVEFFTYGGTLEATHGHDKVVYALRSPAPILEIDLELQDFSAQLAFETEVLLGEAQAQWHGNEQGFARRLAQLDPARCYLAAVHSILSHYEHNRRLSNGFHLFHMALAKEREQLVEMGLWPADAARLEDLLAPHNPGSTAGASHGSATA